MRARTDSLSEDPGTPGPLQGCLHGAHKLTMAADTPGLPGLFRPASAPSLRDRRALAADIYERNSEVSVSPIPGLHGLWFTHRVMTGSCARP